MKYIFTVIFLGLLSLTTFSQNRLYENPQFDELAQDHEVIAIMPFKTSINLRPKQMKRLSPGQLERMEDSESIGIQAALYSWLLTREKRKGLSVEVQDPAITNAILNKAMIDTKSAQNYTPTELAELLGVDAVVMGSFKTDKPISEATALLIESVFNWGGSATNKAVMNLYIYNAKDSEVLINYHRSLDGSLGSNMDNLINRLMRKITRKMAYTK